MNFKEIYHFEPRVYKNDASLIIEDDDGVLQQSFEFEGIDFDIIKDYLYTYCVLGEAMAYIGRKFGHNYPTYMGTCDFNKYKRNERINKFYRNEL